MNSTMVEAVPIQRKQRSVNDILKDIDDMGPLNEDHSVCMQAVFRVLKEYGMESTFGLVRLHKHFDLNEGEVLIEYTDKEQRISTVRPVPAEEAGNVVETIWALVDGEHDVVLGCRQYCGADVHGNHSSFHKGT